MSICEVWNGFQSPYHQDSPFSIYPLKIHQILFTPPPTLSILHTSGGHEKLLESLSSWLVSLWTSLLDFHNIFVICWNPLYDFEITSRLYLIISLLPQDPEENKVRNPPISADKNWLQKSFACLLMQKLMQKAPVFKPISNTDELASPVPFMGWGKGRSQIICVFKCFWEMKTSRAEREGGSGNSYVNHMPMKLLKLWSGALTKLQHSQVWNWSE